MPLEPADIAVLVVYLVVVFGIGLYLSRRASRNTEQFFVAGRSLPWWIIGTSMVATTFAADTPLVVSGLVARGGIFENWMWWQWGIGGIVAVFLFAKLWRRAGITTDAELIEMRYDGKPAAALRCYRAVWFGLLQNVLIIAWVIKAMAKIVIVVMGWDDSHSIMGLDAEVFTVLVLFLVAVTYTALSGLWGVVMTDLLQFSVAMGGSIYLAVSAVVRLGGVSGIRERLALQGFDVSEVMRIVPRAAPLDGMNPFTEFLVLILIVWWASYSVDGGGYIAQRLFAARNERHSAMGYLWYSLAHICLRPWPWIAVGLAGMAVFGAVDDPETYYPLMMKSLLPPGMFGLVIASFFAAFMSTIDTHLNWGSSLLVNDLYRRFIARGRSEREYVAAARIFVAALAVFGALASFAVKDISFAWKLILSVTAGVGSVYIARWYWWRVNAWSEITAMAAALICTVVISVLSTDPRFRGAPVLEFPFSTALTVFVSVPAWVIVTLLTKPVERDHLVSFYRRVRPGGPGWRRISREAGEQEREARGVPAVRTFVKIATGIVLINASLIGTGKVFLEDYGTGVILLSVSVMSGVLLYLMLRSEPE